MFISFSTCHEVLPIEEIPKNAFSTSCPEVVKLERFRMIPSITSQKFIVFMYLIGDNLVCLIIKNKKL